MSEERFIAVPSDAPGGLAAVPSAHFGHCDAYTVARIKGHEILDVQVCPNTGHEHGNCLAPVQELASRGVKVLIAGGMGMRPLAGLRQAGMEVYHAADMATVGDVLRAFAEGRLSPFGEDRLCRGNCGKH